VEFLSIALFADLRSNITVFVTLKPPPRMVCTPLCPARLSLNDFAAVAESENRFGVAAR
jgi:hypothetical protein